MKHIFSVLILTGFLFELALRPCMIQNKFYVGYMGNLKFYFLLSITPVLVENFNTSPVRKVPSSDVAKAGCHRTIEVAIFLTIQGP